MSTSAEIEILVPDIGDFEEVEVIEIIAHPGDEVGIDDPLITLESDKATMDIPAPRAGRISAIKVAIGDKISQGSLIALLSATGDSNADRPAPASATTASKAPDGPRAQEPLPLVSAPPEVADAPPRGPRPPPVSPAAPTPAKAHASPGVRKFARELGVEIALVASSGRAGRILKTDVQQYVKGVVEGSPRQGGFAMPEMPVIDFSQFGEIETRPLGKIKRLTGENLHRSWVTAPHVTQFDEADITDLETFRKSRIEEGKTRDVKLTLVAFLLKAAAVALARYPEFNSSLSPDGQSLIFKKYIHIGLAVDTDNGLVAPVIRDVDRKGLFDLAREIDEVSAKARNRKLSPADMRGACFTISSLGGIGGTAFTPIVNVPEVAILGVSRSAIKPVYQDGQFVPRLMLPYSLSYDHRVIDGATAARFTRFVGTLLNDIRHILL